MKKLDELRQKRAKLIADARALNTKAEGEKRDMNAEEREQFDKMMDVSLGEMDAEIKGAEAQEKRLATLATEEARLNESAGRQTVPAALENRGGGGAGAGAAPSELRYKVGGRERVIQFSGQRSTEEYNRAFRRALTTPMGQFNAEEQRALAADNDATGGFLVGPQQFAAQLIQAVDNMVFVRRLANVLPPITKSESLGIPTREADVADADWTAEIQTGSEDSSLTFGKRELRPHPMAKRIKISKKLLRSAALNPEAIVMERLAYKVGVTEEKSFLTGSGAQQPLGVFTASTDGISTGRDISTGNTTTTIGADNLFEAKFSLKVQYWGKAQWAFHRDALKMISKLKDGEGRYLFQPAITEAVPDRLLGLGINLSEYVPNTFTTGLYVGILGDWSQYWIVDALDLQVQVLLELYAENNQNGYIIRKETDGAPVLEEAFARLALG